MTTGNNRSRYDRRASARYPDGQCKPHSHAINVETDVNNESSTSDASQTFTTRYRTLMAVCMRPHLQPLM